MLQRPTTLPAIPSRLSSEEYALLRETGQRLGLSEEDVRLLINQIRSTTYAAAKQALRDGPAGSGPATSHPS